MEGDIHLQCGLSELDQHDGDPQVRCGPRPVGERFQDGFPKESVSEFHSAGRYHEQSPVHGGIEGCREILGRKPHRCTEHGVWEWSIAGCSAGKKLPAIRRELGHPPCHDRSDRLRNAHI